MFRLKENIINIKYFVVSNKHLIVKTLDNKVVYNNEMLDNNILDDVILYEDNIYYNNNKGIVIKNLINTRKNQIDDFFILNTKPMNCQYGLVYFNDDFSLFIFNKKNYNKNKIAIKDYDWGVSFFSNTHIFINNQNKIQTYSLTTPQTPQWQFDLSQFGTFQKREENLPYKVEKFIGIHQDRLYVALNGGMLLEIDIATGELTHQWQNIMTTDRGFSYPVETNTFTLDKQLGKLVSFYTSDFITIDLASKKVNITPMDEELKKFDGRAFKPTSINYAIDETHIYTLVTLYAPEADFIKESVVAFNKQTKKIDWNFTDYQFGMAGGDTPKLAGNKLYLKVNITNLYIFEKTSNESI